MKLKKTTTEVKINLQFNVENYFTCLSCLLSAFSVSCFLFVCLFGWLVFVSVGLLFFILPFLLHIPFPLLFAFFFFILISCWTVAFVTEGNWETGFKWSLLMKKWSFATIHSIQQHLLPSSFNTNKVSPLHFWTQLI